MILQDRRLLEGEACQVRLHRRPSEGSRVLNIFNSDVGNYPVANEIKRVSVNVTTIKHLLGQSGKLNARRSPLKLGLSEAVVGELTLPAKAEIESHPKESDQSLLYSGLFSPRSMTVANASRLNGLLRKSSMPASRQAS